ncbi:hypothetical protein IP69_11655 [Bosea sp. AAP35]|uniref:hypothetical protein n=1 Tax=Bosea sp. AAP35 TaxID=1523417 RepID=UPI0006B918F1|nr:hypothetical protein [Bosea sp. AAP35]KPF68315.1 hypothetical protein IP69_11655 [Bosea sp. AAP35]
MQAMVLAAAVLAAVSLSVHGAERRKADFLQDYITCEMWMKHHRTTATEIHAAVGRWIVDLLRQNAPNKLSHLDDTVIINAVERHCTALPETSLSSAAFLAGLRLPES